MLNHLHAHPTGLSSFSRSQFHFPGRFFVSFALIYPLRAKTHFAARNGFLCDSLAYVLVLRKILALTLSPRKICACRVASTELYS